MMPDLHPEELFDKAARGELSPQERSLLDAHLAQCAVCRFEHQVARDFAAVPMPALDIDQLVSNALTAKTTHNLRPRRSRGATMLLAAAVTLGGMASFAAVGQVTGVLPRLISAITARPSPEAAAKESRHSSPGRTELVVSPPPSVEAPPPPPPTPLPEAETLRAPAEEIRRPSASPNVEHPHRPPLTAAASAPRAPQRLTEATATTASAAAPSAPVNETPTQIETAASLFAAANQARLHGDRPFALARYRQVLANHPASAEATQTQAMLGRLLLDQGDAAQALEHLEDYLARGDRTLAEEVLSARAQAYASLGRTAAERAAWQQLVDQFPESIHAVRARARLGIGSVDEPKQ